MLAPAMFASLIIAVIAGFPVAFSIAAVAAVFGVIGILTGHFTPAFLLAMPLRIEGFFQNDNLLAIPLFLFMGMLLERTQIAEDMLHALDRLFGRIRGGMAYTVVVVGASLAAMTGFVSASVIAIGLIALPAMLRKGYDPRLATGVIAASGTLAQILPPSIVLIVLADQLDVSLIEIYHGVLIPSALLVGLYLLYVFVVTRWRPERAPAAQAKAPGSPNWAEVWRARRGGRRVPARPDPAGARVDLLRRCHAHRGRRGRGRRGAAAGRRATQAHLAQPAPGDGRDRHPRAAACCSSCSVRRSLRWSFVASMGTCGSSRCSSTFRPASSGSCSSSTSSIFLLAFFLDFFEIAFIVLPLVAPVAAQDGHRHDVARRADRGQPADFVHAPAVRHRAVQPQERRARAVETTQIYWGAVPFILIQLFMVGILIVFPNIVTTTAEAAQNIENIHIPIPPAD